MRKFFDRLLLWLLKRLQEKSTYTGIGVLVATCFGKQLPEWALNAMAQVGPFVAAALIFASTADES